MDEVRTSPSGQLTWSETGALRVAIFHDSKSCGESTHRPAIRQPPFRKDAYLKLLKSVLARSPDGNVPEQDAYFLFDGGRDGLYT